MPGWIGGRGVRGVCMPGWIGGRGGMGVRGTGVRRRRTVRDSSGNVRGRAEEE
jgi:hypothetical protein